MGGFERNQQMHMIGHAADAQRLSTQAAHHPTKIFVQARLLGLEDDGLTVFCGEDEVVEQAGVGGWHGGRGWHPCRGA